MTPEQRERWEDFAIRMARTCFPDRVKPDAGWIEEQVKDFFWCLDPGDVATFESWDHSSEYPRSTGYFEHPRRPCVCCWSKPERWPCARHDTWSAANGAGLEGHMLDGHWRRPADAYVRWRVGWAQTYGCDAWSKAAEFFSPGIRPDCTCNPARSFPGSPDPACDICGGDPDFRTMANGPYVCDLMSDAETEAYGYPRIECELCRTPADYEVSWKAKRAGLEPDACRRYARWRSESPWWLKCTCDEEDQAAWEAWRDQWYGPVNCCIRAGIDFAADPSAGVVGFTAGDVRAMYPEGVPEWVFPPGENLWYWSGAENGTFADLSDSAGVVL